MDAYFCYIHRPARAVADLKILNCTGKAELDRRLVELTADYPSARVEVFQGERLVRVIERPAA
jgi:hypothetical protein